MTTPYQLGLMLAHNAYEMEKRAVKLPKIPLRRALEAGGEATMRAAGGASDDVVRGTLLDPAAMQAQQAQLRGAQQGMPQQFAPTNPRRGFELPRVKPELEEVDLRSLMTGNDYNPFG